MKPKDNRSQTLHPQAQDVIDQIGDFIEYWGFKRVHGRIWALVFLSEEPVDARYIMEHLQISKALVSISLKDLLHHNVLVLTDKKFGTFRYRSNPKMSNVIINVIINREATLLLKIKNSCELLSRSDVEHKTQKISKKRVHKLSQMVTSADKALKVFIALRQFNFSDFGRALNLNEDEK